MQRRSVALLFLTATMAAVSVAKASGPPTTDGASRDRGLETFLRHYVGTAIAAVDSTKGDEVRYAAAAVDLDGDGRPEVVVRLMGQDWCGSGGCNTLVLTRRGETFRLVSSISITQLPITVPPEVSHGWHDLGVTVCGGGIQPCYEARLPFDGSRYPFNPAVPPATRLEGKPGRTIIPESARGRVLPVAP